MEVKPEDLLLGADPELFIRRSAAGKEWVSAWPLVPGTKKDPHPVDGGAVQHDGLAAEYNIHPAGSEQEFVDLNNKVLTVLSTMLPDYELVNRPCVTFNKGVWDATCEEERELGCDPDMNAYTREENVPPEPDVDFRTGAGHIHVGWTKDMNLKDFGHLDACNIMAKELDIYLGMPFAWLDSSKSAQKRRLMYGQAGAYRVKPYGMEYRVLSNFWVGNDILMRWIYKNTMLAFTNLLAGKSLAADVNPQEYINSKDSDNLDNIPYICEDHKIPLPQFK